MLNNHLVYSDRRFDSTVMFHTAGGTNEGEYKEYLCPTEKGCNCTYVEMSNFKNPNMKCYLLVNLLLCVFLFTIVFVSFV